MKKIQGGTVLYSALALAGVDVLLGSMLFLPVAVNTIPSNHGLPNARIVAVTRTNSRYHNPWCDLASNSLQMPVDVAHRWGYSACSRCGG